MTDTCKTSIDDLNAHALPALPIAPAPALTMQLSDKGAAIGKDCAGVDLPPVPIVGAVQTVPHPQAVQLVKICSPTATLDREYSTLCAQDGTKVLVVTAWDTTAPLATAPTVEAYTLAGAIYSGDRTLLTDCGTEKLDMVSEPYCSGGLQYERVSFYSVSTTPPALVSTLWRDASGAVVAEPSAGALGACPALVDDRKVLIYLERNGGVITMADIVAACGTIHIQSVTVKQISGDGAVSGDAGSGVPLSAGETWSWSAITGNDAWDHLGASALMMAAGTGEQRITATFIP